MTKIMHTHKDILEFVEPALDVSFVPIGAEHPENEEDIMELVEEQASTSAGEEANDNVHVDANTTRRGHYVLWCCPGGGKGPYGTYQQADAAMKAIAGSAKVVGMTSNHGGQIQNCASNNNCNQYQNQLQNIYNGCINNPSSCPLSGGPGGGGGSPRRRSPRRRRAGMPGLPIGPRRRTGGGGGGGAGSAGYTTIWGLDRIDDDTGLDKDYSPPLDGKGVHIYVVDTGVRTTHQDFGGRAVPTIDTSSGKLIECDPNDHKCAQDCYSRARNSKCGHGSHCAGT